MKQCIPIIALVAVIISACYPINNLAPNTKAISTITSEHLPDTDRFEATPTLPIDQETLVTMSLASSEQNVALPDLNVPSNFRLIVRDESKDIGILRADVGEIQKGVISNEIPDLYSLKASPDGRYITYLVQTNDATYVHVSTLIDNELDLIWNIKASDNSIIIQWLSNHLLAIWMQSSRLTCPDSVSFINVITGELIIPKSTFPILAFPFECGRFPALDPSGNLIVYPAWKLHNLETGETENILPGIQDIDPTSPTIEFKWTNRGFSLIDLRSKILSGVFNVPLKQLRNSNISTQTIILPGLAEAVVWSSPKWWSFDGELIGLDLASLNIEPQDYVFANRAVPTNFYLLNLNLNKITNYNLDRAKIKEGEYGEVRLTYASPNEKFLAWTIYDLTSGDPRATKILDLSDGATAIIDNVEVLGWIIQTP